MKRLVTFLAVALAAVVMAVPAGAKAPRNNEDGGSGYPTGYVVSTVYIDYGGYWHYANCGWFVFPWGTIFDKCW